MAAPEPPQFGDVLFGEEAAAGGSVATAGGSEAAAGGSEAASGGSQAAAGGSEAAAGGSVAAAGGSEAAPLPAAAAPAAPPTMAQALARDFSAALAAFRAEAAVAESVCEAVQSLEAGRDSVRKAMQQLRDATEAVEAVVMLARDHGIQCNAPFQVLFAHLAEDFAEVQQALGVLPKGGAGSGKDSGQSGGKDTGKQRRSGSVDKGLGKAKGNDNTGSDKGLGKAQGSDNTGSDEALGQGKGSDDKGLGQGKGGKGSRGRGQASLGDGSGGQRLYAHFGSTQADVRAYTVDAVSPAVERAKGKAFDRHYRSGKGEGTEVPDSPRLCIGGRFSGFKVWVGDLPTHGTERDTESQLREFLAVHDLEAMDINVRPGTGESGLRWAVLAFSVAADCRRARNVLRGALCLEPQGHWLTAHFWCKQRRWRVYSRGGGWADALGRMAKGVGGA